MNSPPAWLFALGDRDLPPAVTIAARRFAHVQTFKHDFFAATGLYQSVEGTARIVLKIGRQKSFFGLPLRWIGRFLARREGRMYQLLDGLEGVPRWIGTWEDTGLAHDFVPGRPLAADDRPGDDFFPRLSRLLETVHARQMAYVDLEKRGNILVGEDGRPWLIDFQISWHVASPWWRRRWICRRLTLVLQRSDRYHLLKHWRRQRADQFTDAGLIELTPGWIRIHRAVARPLTMLRRRVLVWLGARRTATGRSE